ncbi:MAG: 4Fe-4S binding protein [Clostridia bacterium]|nr:4Fe-4S binding protein [Clostridia bacterium]
MKISILASVQWAQVGIVIGIFAAIAVVLAACILVVTKLCKTQGDAKTEAVLSHLAGANCGGCGCTGCAGFAEKLARGEADLSDCHVTAAAEKQKIADVLGVPYEDAAPTVNVCACNGGCNAENEFIYAGAVDCAQEIKLYGGSKVCKYGCLGKGSCAGHCTEGAASIVNGCAEVDPDRCTSCGACMKNCPKNLFRRIPADAKVYVACSSRERGKQVMDACKVGCIGCGKCAKTCPAGAIAMTDNLPEIDYVKCVKCGACADACPRRSIVKRY